MIQPTKRIIAAKIKEKQAEKNALQIKQKDTSLFRAIEHIRLNARIAEKTEDLEELKSEKTRLITRAGVRDEEGVKHFKARIKTERDKLERAEKTEIRATVELEGAVEKFHELEANAAAFDQNELMDARLALRPEEERRAVCILKEANLRQYNADTIKQARADVAKLLNETPTVDKPHPLCEDLRQKQTEVQERALTKKNKSRDFGR